MMEQLNNLKGLLMAFLSKSIPSTIEAGKIEGILLEEFYDYEEFQDLLEGLASYKPSGKIEGLYDEQSIRPICIEALERIDRLLNK